MRTNAYVGRYVVGNKEDENAIAAIRRHVSAHNQLETVRQLNNSGYTRKLYRVCLKGRVAINKEFNHQTGNWVSFNWGGDLVGGLRNAAEVDLYIQRRFELNY